MIRKSLISLPVLLLFGCIDFSNPEECPGNGNNFRYLDIQTITTNSLKYNGAISNFYYPSNNITIPKNEVIDATRYIIELETTQFDLIANSKANKSFNFSLINSAVASCLPIFEPVSNETISMIKISSDADFNNDYPAGSNLNLLFLVRYAENFNGYINYPTDNVNDYVITAPSGQKRIHIQLIQAPTISKIHNFKIEYMHKSGELFELYPSTIKFQ